MVKVNYNCTEKCFPNNKKSQQERTDSKQKSRTSM